MIRRSASKWSAAPIVAAITAVLLLVLPGVGAADEGWIIERFHVDIVVSPEGSFTVIEQVDVDFAGLQRRGIFRTIPYRQRYDDERDRLIEIDRWHVEASAGTPADLHLERGANEVTARIGHPDRYISGRRSYRISYRVRGALNSFETHEELYWNVTGDGWPVPIRDASVTVVGVPVTRMACFVGAYGSTRTCDRVELEEGAPMASASSRDLFPGQGMTVAVAHPQGSVDVGPPILAHRWSLRRALTGHVAAVPATVLTALLVAVGLGLLLTREARDRVTRGGRTVDGTADDGGTPRRLFEPRAVPVRYRPPGDLRPAQLGVIVDEVVHPVDISATVVDLAVRGHLRIVELSTGKLWWSRTDWELHRTESPDDELLPYEATLLDALFEDGSPVVLSELSGEFHSDYLQVRGMLYDDAVERRWFNRDPRTTRGMWLGAGIASTFVAGCLFTILLTSTTVALAGVPLVLGGVVLTIAHRWMPHRTTRGSRLLEEALGFREFIVTAEAGLARFAEEENLFTRYLPYAVVFGVTDRWARAFADLGAQATADVGRFYVGADGTVPDLNRLSSGLSDMGRAGVALAATPASSGSSGFSSGGGFSGGGSGGGGGGSW